MSHTSASATDDDKLAVVTITFTVLALSMGDALIKGMSVSFSLWQIFVLRSLIAVPVLAAVLRVRSVALVPRSPVWSILRSLMLVAMWGFYYAALPNVPLSIAAAAYYTLPIFITLFSAPLAAERVSKAGWFAVALGFAGVVLILRPKAGEFNAYAALPLISAILYGLAMILTRTKCRDEHPLVLSLALNVTFILAGLAGTVLVGLFRFGSLFLLAPWSPMTIEGWGAMALLSLSLLIGSIGAAIAYQIGRSSTVAVFDFSYVGFAAVWGLIFFGEVPDAVSLAGMLLILSAGTVAIRGIPSRP